MEITGCAVAWEIITGKINTNSTSKIRNTIAIKKNRRDNGKRGAALGVNPHSKGLLFSRSNWNLVDNLTPRPINTNPRITTIVRVIINLII